jgi:hypothetical protein
VRRHGIREGQLEGVDDAAGLAGAVDDEESDEPDDFSDEPEDFSEEEEPEEPLVADPAVTEEPDRESVR